MDKVGWLFDNNNINNINNTNDNNKREKRLAPTLTVSRMSTLNPPPSLSIDIDLPCSKQSITLTMIEAYFFKKSDRKNQTRLNLMAAAASTPNGARDSAHRTLWLALITNPRPFLIGGHPTPPRPPVR